MHQFANRGWTKKADIVVPDSQPGRSVWIGQLDVAAVRIAAGREHSDANSRDGYLGASRRSHQIQIATDLHRLTTLQETGAIG